jgi:hypothetical protein
MALDVSDVRRTSDISGADRRSSTLFHKVLVTAWSPHITFRMWLSCFSCVVSHRRRVPAQTLWASAPSSDRSLNECAICFPFIFPNANVSADHGMTCARAVGTCSHPHQRQCVHVDPALLSPVGQRGPTGSPVCGCGKLDGGQTLTMLEDSDWGRAMSSSLLVNDH